MFYPINNMDFCKYVYSESNVSNTFQISWDSGNTKLGKQVKGSPKKKNSLIYSP